MLKNIVYMLLALALLFLAAACFLAYMLDIGTYSLHLFVLFAVAGFWAVAQVEDEPKACVRYTLR